MIGILLAAALLAGPPQAPAPRCEAPRDARGFKRSQAILRAFVRESPQGACPATGRRALPCPGYEAHHLVWLVCGGKDEPANLVWLTVEQHDAVHARTICKARCVP